MKSTLKWEKMGRNLRQHTELKKGEYWCLQPDGEGGGTMFGKLDKGMSSALPTIDLQNTESDQFASAGHSSRYRAVKINPAIRSGVPLETGQREEFGLMRYSTDRVADFAPNLWHELVAHAVLGHEHPKEQANVYEFVRVKAILAYGARKNDYNDFETSDIDPSIVEENHARRTLALPLRRRQYMDVFYPAGHQWHVDASR